MKNKIKYISIIFVCILLHMNLNAQDALTADIMYPTFNQNCQNGNIDLHIKGGFPPYDVVWYRVIWNFPNNYEYVVQSNYGIQGINDGEDLMNVMSGFYRVEVTDALCGTVSKSFKIRCICSEDCNIRGEVRDATCDRKGRIEIDIDCEESGHYPLTYEWNDGVTWKNRTNLDPGTYCLTVTDVDGCTFDECFEVGGDQVLQVEVVDKQNIELCGEGNDCNGSINIDVISGAGGYTYKWSNGRTTEDISNLCKGTYTVTVTDNAGCVEVLSIEICCCEEWIEFFPGDYDIVQGDCYSSPYSYDPLTINGQAHSDYDYPYIETDVSGGTGDYICVWSGPNGFTSYDCWGLEGPLEPGEYCLTVDDGCDEITECFTIVDCDQQNITINANVEETCDGVAAGSISLVISGGTSPYIVIWDNGMSGQSINGLGEGEYCAEITDANGCESGPHCFNVGSKQGDVTTSTIPCTRTVTCNGSEYVEYFGYEQTLDCNILYSYCPATGETVVQNLGWVYTYVSNCTLYGVCQDGRTVVIAYGERVYGPFIVEDYSCPTGYRCYSYACYFPEYGVTTLDESSPSYCSTIYYQRDDNCGYQKCRADVYCGESYMGSFCTERECLFFLQDDPTPDEVAYKTKGEIIKSFASDVELTNIVNKHEEVEIRNSIEELNVKFTDSERLLVKIYPNPSDGVITFDFVNNVQKLDVKVFDVMGKLVYNNSNINIEGTELKLDLSFITSGIYFVHLSDQSGNITVERLIKE